MKRPRNLEAEGTVLSAYMVDSSWLRVEPVLAEADFDLEPHRKIYRAMRELEALGAPIDPIVIKSRFQDEPEVCAAVNALNCSIPDIGRIPYYAELVIEAARKRQLQRLGHDLITASRNGDDSSAIAARFSQRFDQILSPDSRSLNKERESGIEVVRGWEETEPSPVEYSIGKILPSGHISGLFADGGQGKTLVSYGIGCHVAAGEKAFLGLEVQQGTVLVIDAENLGRSEFLRRLHRISRGMGREKPPEGLYYVELDDSLMNDAVFTKCEEVVSSIHASLVIVDSFAAASAASDQINAAEVVTFMKRLRRLGTVLVVDHIPKPVQGQQSPTMRPFGSTFKYNLVRSSLRLEQGDSGAMRLTQVKHNFGPLCDTISFAMTFGYDSVKFQAIDRDDDRLAGLHEKPIPIAQRILTELEQFGEEGTTPGQLADLTGATKKTIANQLSILRRKGKAQPVGEKRWKAVDNVESPSQSLGKETGKREEGLWQ